MSGKAAATGFRAATKRVLSDPCNSSHTLGNPKPSNEFLGRLNVIPIADFETCKIADADRQSGLRGFIRTTRRFVKRCWLDAKVINQPRIFCQNSGGCGSTFIVRLLEANNVERVFHEKSPDLLEIGLEHFEAPIAEQRLVRLLRYTRHDAYFEANNRLFTLSKELSIAFPNATFIHLHRDGADSVRSAMSKPNIESYLKHDIRFQGNLAGYSTDDAFTRFCHHWANMNRRIHQDLQTVAAQVTQLRFENLVAGKLQNLEDRLGRPLTNPCEPVNVGRVSSKGKFPSYSGWSVDQKATFERICGPVMGYLGR